ALQIFQCLVSGLATSKATWKFDDFSEKAPIVIWHEQTRVWLFQNVMHGHLRHPLLFVFHWPPLIPPTPPHRLRDGSAPPCVHGAANLDCRHDAQWEMRGAEERHLPTSDDSHR